MEQRDKPGTTVTNICVAGIGTYTTGEQSVNTTGLWGRFKRSVSQTLDQGIGTTFDSHVIAAYRFIMRYYEDGDKIYLFGFSRGAFTARFLARMIFRIGLLSKGNEEMVPFAYKSYQDFENGILQYNKVIKPGDWMDNFKHTFCRDEVRVHFLGLFDTVNSVGYFDLPFTRKTYLPDVEETAQHIRHAVAIDERRCKFKPALLHQDVKGKNQKNTEDIKEVYFPGNHGDVGGGWAADGTEGAGEDKDPVQLSDLALEWMIEELQELPAKDPEEKLVFNGHVETFLQNLHGKIDQAITADIHDVLRFDGGEPSWLKVIFWNILGECLPIRPVRLCPAERRAPHSWRFTDVDGRAEHIPFFKRLELIQGKWVSVTYPPNRGQTRDIPDGACFHESVKKRHDKIKYEPKNDGMEWLHDGRHAG